MLFEILIFLRLKHINRKHQNNLQNNIRQILKLDHLTLHVFRLILDSDNIQNPRPRGRIISLNKNIKSINQNNGTGINKQSKSEVAKFMLMGHHTEDQKHNE